MTTSRQFTRDSYEVTHDIRHGTTAGYARHANKGERPCDACYFAKQEYDARLRKADEKTRQSRLCAKAQQLALRRLKDEHLNTYHEYYAEAKARLTIIQTMDDAT